MMSVVYFLLLVGVLVAIHEFGHFVAAKLLDFKVTRFSIGFGRPLVRVRYGETTYQLCALPLGGYVRILGEDIADAVSPEEAPRAFSARPLWRRIVVIFAGPAANFLLPVFIYFVSFSGTTELPAAVIGDVVPGTPAERAELRSGDRIVAIDGESVRYWEEVTAAVSGSVGRELQLEIARGERTLEKLVSPIEVVRRRDGRTVHQGVIGIAREPFLAQVAVVDPASPAARAGLVTGDIVYAIDGEAIETWSELEDVVSESPRRMSLAYFRPESVAGLSAATLVPAHTEVVTEVRRGPDRAQMPGVSRSVHHGFAPASMVVASVEPMSPADEVGLRRGDLIVSVDGRLVRHWPSLQGELSRLLDRPFTLTWQRLTNGQVVTKSATVTQRFVTVADEFGNPERVLIFGVTTDFVKGRGQMVAIEGRFGYALSKSVERTGEAIRVMGAGFFSILRGRSPSAELAGPITMLRVASVSGSRGWEPFFWMIALVSISVGIINLLPIPVLDGGHVLLFVVEAVLGKPLSQRTRRRITYAGIGLVGLITALAVRNDIVRILT